MIWLQFRIEVARGSFLKREGPKIEYFSPIPCPFNYGSVEGEVAEDGDAPDVVLMGERVPTGVLREGPLVGRVFFVDAGKRDDKQIVSALPLSPSQKQKVENFFRFYAPIRKILNMMQGKRGETRYEGTQWLE
jgi:inorganic pyrophosphatase